ncbi:MAG: hypothetical protein H8D80_02095 [Proteobacteria bacterium]|nr:hypothetical protein [Pseudomonadota bacterium]
MSSKGRNASLRNAMHRHPQMSEKSVYFAGQDENSSNTFLRWLGSEWETIHEPSLGLVPEEYKSYNRKYLPVGLANGAAGMHPGYGCKWNYAGGSAEYVDFYDDPDIIPYHDTTSNYFDGVSGEHPWSTQGNPDNEIDYKKYDMPSEGGITYSSVDYNDIAVFANRISKFAWPHGEYRPVFADARPHYTDSNGIPIPSYGTGITAHGSLWRIKGNESTSYYHLPVYYGAGEWISIVDSGAQLTASLSGDPYKLEASNYIGDWSEAKREDGEHPIGFHAPYNAVEFQEDGDIHFRFYPNAWQLGIAQESNGITGDSNLEIFRKVHAAMFGMNPNYLSQQRLEIKVTDDVNNIILECHTYFDKLEWFSYDVVVKHADWTVTTGTLPNTSTGWWGPSHGNYHWGENPTIQVQIKNESGQDWTHHPPNDNLIEWKQETPHDVPSSYDGWCRVEREYDNYQRGLDYKPEIRTPTRSVLLYDISNAIPAGAPLMSAELFLTSMGRWNWPNEEVSPDWTTNETVLNGRTGPRRLKVGKGAQYQISQLHPSTTKNATWGTYDGTNPWTDLTDGQIHGETCSIMPNVFNMGGGESTYKYFGMGWKYDQLINGNPWYEAERQPADTHSLQEWMSFEHYAYQYSSDDYWTNTAVRGPSQEEHRGITGGGVMVVSPEDVSDGGAIGDGFSQNEIYELTGRRARDVIDFDIANSPFEVQRTSIDVTDFARDAFYNMDGKLRLAITGKTITGNAQDPGDIYKSESSWSHYAYQYNNNYPYGGGTRNGGVDTPGPDAQHPYCGPHTIKTEFYSLSDDSVSQVFENLEFKNELDLITYDDVLDFTSLITGWQNMMAHPYSDAASWRWATLNHFGNNHPTIVGTFRVWFYILFAGNTGPLESDIPTEWLTWIDDWNVMQQKWVQHQQNSDVVQIVCPSIVGSNGEVVTIGEDSNGTDSESIGYKCGSSQQCQVTIANQRFQSIQCYVDLEYPLVGGVIPNGGKTLLRHYDSGENYYQEPIQSGTFKGYFLGDLSTSTPTLGEGSGYASSMEAKFGQQPAGGYSNYMFSNLGAFPVTDVGDVFGITYDNTIPASEGVTHDNRGTYSVKNIIEPNIIEVNEDVTPQVINNGPIGGDYGTVILTNYSNRPYLKITYSEQEAYGV